MLNWLNRKEEHRDDATLYNEERKPIIIKHLFETSIMESDNVKLNTERFKLYLRLFIRISLVYLVTLFEHLCCNSLTI